MSWIDSIDIELLNKHSITKSYKNNEIIFNEDEICKNVFFIEKGEVSIITLTHNEREEVITYLRKGETFGDFLLFSDEDKFLGIAICKKPCLLKIISKDNLLKLLKDESILMSFLKQISSKALKIKQENKLLKHRNIRDRIIHYLLSETKRRNKSFIEINTVTQLASILALPRPSLSRELSLLEQDGIILINKKGHKCFIELLYKY